jgi:hypothetical protein
VSLVAFVVAVPDPGSVVLPGRAGWLVWDLGDEVDVRVRVGEREPLLTVVGVYVAASDGSELKGAELRRPVVGRLQDALRHPELQAEVRRSFESADAPDLSPCAVSAIEARRLIQRAAVHRLDRPEDLLLPPAPDGRVHKPDEFYANVARAYAAASARSARPAMELARANNLSHEQVRRWLREARRRGLA